MRAFIAVELPDEIRAALAALQRQVAETRADVKWTEEANLHVTMRFLGEITDLQRQGIEEKLRSVASHHDVTAVQLTSVWAFPSVTSPRVLWVGIGEGKEALTNMAEEIEQGVVALGLPNVDHPFAAHITLGRVRSPRYRVQLVTALQHPTWTPPPQFTATHLTLFQSTLTPSGPIYSLLSKFPFSAA